MVPPQPQNRSWKTWALNADDILARYQKSPILQKMISAYDYPNTNLARERTEAFKESVAWEKPKHLPKSCDLTTSFWAQLMVCTKRQYQILWGEKSTFLIKQVLSCIMAMIAGSCFYDSPDTSAGLFTKGGRLLRARIQLHCRHVRSHRVFQAGLWCPNSRVSLSAQCSIWSAGTGPCGRYHTIPIVRARHSGS